MCKIRFVCKLTCMQAFKMDCLQQKYQLHMHIPKWHSVSYSRIIMVYYSQDRITLAVLHSMQYMFQSDCVCLVTTHM